MNYDLEAAAKLLEDSGEYRVFRRLDLTKHIVFDDGTPTRTAIFIDVETTGLDLQSNEIIELAMVPFRYTIDGRIVSVGEAFHQFNEPKAPIPAEVVAITGITDEMVAGSNIQVDAVESFVANASLMIAHNAAFDRPFAEAISSAFAAKPWACTMCDIDWRHFGLQARRLSDLLSSFGYFFDAHRAVDDCKAGISLLTMTMEGDERTPLNFLLSSARQATWKIYADGAPFDTKEVLRRRGYKWNPDKEKGPRAWWIEKSEEELNEEVSFLQREIFRSEVEIPLYRISAFQRYSTRLPMQADKPN